VVQKSGQESWRLGPQGLPARAWRQFWYTQAKNCHGKSIIIVEPELLLIVGNPRLASIILAYHRYSWIIIDNPRLALTILAYHR
jgi:hypothetical protein